MHLAILAPADYVARFIHAFQGLAHLFLVDAIVHFPRTPNPHQVGELTGEQIGGRGDIGSVERPSRHHIRRGVDQGEYFERLPVCSGLLQKIRAPSIGHGSRNRFHFQDAAGNVADVYPLLQVHASRKIDKVREGRNGLKIGSGHSLSAGQSGYEKNQAELDEFVVRAGDGHDALAA